MGSGIFPTDFADAHREDTIKSTSYELNTIEQ